MHPFPKPILHYNFTMKITLITYGSRGDVQPFLALSLGLKKAGHSVILAAPQRFAGFVEQHGIPCAPLAGDPDELSHMLNDSGENVFRMVRSLQKHIFSIAPDVVRTVRKALDGSDLLVHSFAFTTGGYSFARELNIPDVSLQLFPAFAPTRDFPAIGAPEGMPGWLNRLSHQFSTSVFWHGGNVGYHKLRRQAPADFPAQVEWPFTPVRDRPLTPLLFAYSPRVIPFPVDWDPDSIYVPGYFFLDTPDYQASESLLHFLEDGVPPVCVTFGSMINRDAEKVMLVAVEALRRTGNRAVFLTGWGGRTPGNIPSGTYFLESAPHDWLFPRCKAVIHHGGSGTTAAGLHAGVPSILVPHIGDQPFWGGRVAAIGAGPHPIPVAKLDTTRLEHALIEADTESIRDRAAELGRLIRSENGVGRAVSIIESCATRFRC